MGTPPGITKNILWSMVKVEYSRILHLGTPFLSSSSLVELQRTWGDLCIEMKVCRRIGQRISRTSKLLPPHTAVMFAQYLHNVRNPSLTRLVRARLGAWRGRTLDLRISRATSAVHAPSLARWLTVSRYRLQRRQMSIVVETRGR